MNNDGITDDVFQGYEKVETIYATQITTENVVRLAQLFKGNVDWTGEEPVLTISHKHSSSTYKVGDWLNNRGRSVPDMRFGGWRPMGTYTGEKSDSDD